MSQSAMPKDYSYIMDTAAVIGSKTPTMFSLYYIHTRAHTHTHTYIVVCMSIAVHKFIVAIPVRNP